MYKTIFTYIMIFILTVNSHGIQTNKSVKIEDIINLKFNNSLQYYLSNAKLYSPLLWREKTVPSYFSITSKALPTISYGRQYGNTFSEFKDQNISISFDLVKILNEIEKKNKLEKNNRFVRQRLLKKITELYIEAINLKKIISELQNIHQLKLKILKEYKKTYKRGGITEHKLTELKLEIVETSLQINKTKNKLIKILLELHFISGIKLT